jgi:hypothetical protein
MSRTFFIAVMAWTLFHAAARCSDLTVSTDFEGASAKVLALDQPTKTVRIMPGGDPVRGWPCWWYLRVDGLAKGEKLTLEVVPSDAILVGPSKNRGKALSAGWSQPQRASVSTDGKHWRHTDQGEMRDAVMGYVVESGGE